MAFGESIKERRFVTKSEEEFAAYCNEHGIKWEYEPDKFEFYGPKRKGFTPDFKINGTYFEITEAHILNQKHSKLRKMRRHFPSVKIALLVYRERNILVYDRYDSNGRPQDSFKIQRPVPNGDLAHYISRFARIVL